MIRYLKKISSNLSFEWNHDLKEIFWRLSPDLWTLSGRNPHRFLKLRKDSPDLSKSRFYDFLGDPENKKLFEKVQADFESYMNPSYTHVSENYPVLEDKLIAYFSMEYGFDTLRTYSGGLGILSGDHIRGASDIGLNMVGVGLLYLHGYYRQYVKSDGTMEVRYRTTVPSGRPLRDYLPLTPVRRKGSRKNLIISVSMGDRDVHAQVWRAQVGRAEVLLLDTNIPENQLHDRNITYRLYQADANHDMERKRRLEQEIVLGIGGAKALQEAGYTPAVYHLNEGHVAFAAIEAIRQLMTTGIGFEEAKKQISKMTGFTTHTPVATGNETFNEALIHHHLGSYLDSFLGPGEKEAIFNCARNRNDLFDMTKLSLMFAGAFSNGVSQLHGSVARKMWNYAWCIDDEQAETTPIGAITNSVHLPYWQSPEIAALTEKACGADYIEYIPDEEVWSAHENRKEKLIQVIRQHRAAGLYRENRSPKEVKEETDSLLSTDYFLIGYARRFAGYKRAGFFLEDEERFFSFLERSYNRHKKPIGIIYAGKPHPSNQSGIDTIKYIHEVAERLEQRALERRFEAKLLFVDGYNIELARRLISGVDVWLNNPIRPLEASGTSGMKAAMNGVLNVSIPDGWCPEGVQSGKNGWLFGQGDENSTEADRNELYNLFENEILPTYFDFPNQLSYSPKWVSMMKSAICDMSRDFNMDRMLIGYIEKMYLPAVLSHKKETFAAAE